MNTVKNMKKITLIIMVLILCAVKIAAAADKIEMDILPADGRNIVITGTVPLSGARIFVEVVRKGEGLKSEKNIYAAEQVKAAKDGTFIIKFTMPENDRADSDKYTDGYFTAYAFSDGFEKAEKDFSYIGEEENRADFFKNFNEAKKNKENMKNFLLNSDNKLFLDSYQILIDEYTSIAKSDIQLFAAELICQIKDNIDENNIADINEIIIAMRFNLADSAEKIEALLSDKDILLRYNINFDNIDKGQKTWFIECVLNVVNGDKIKRVSDLDTIFVRSQMLYELNNAHYSDAFKVLSKYESEFKLIECDAYSKIKQLDEKAVARVMNNLKVLSKTIKSTDELHKNLTQAYAEYKKNMGNNNNSASSGSGSHSASSGRGGMVIGDMKTVTPEIPTKDKETFSDISNVDWARTAINALANADVISGDGSGCFRPMDMVTRAEFIKMLVSALKIAKIGESDFYDVPSTDWSYHYVSAAYSSGIALGIGDNLFGKNDPITRQEAVVFLHRGAVREFIPLEAKRSGSFADNAGIADWAKRSVEIMYNAGYINGLGDNRFEPNKGLTRAQAAVMVYGLYNTL